MEVDGDSRDEKEKEIQENLPFVEKYRPNSLEEIVSHTEIIETLTKFVDEKKLPHLLLHGPPGTGKTTAILAIAKKMYGKNYSRMILELNASDERGIGVVRDKIKSFCATQQIMNSGIKLVVLDEWDAITSAAQFALRRIVEKYTRTTRFWLICNYVSKIIPALQSRCTKFRFRPLKTEHIKTKLDEICTAEKLAINEKAKNAIISLSEGDMRKVLNVLESAALAHDKIAESDVFSCTGRPSPDDIDTILQSLLKDDYKKSLETFMDVKQSKCLTLSDIVKDLHKSVMKSGIPEKKEKCS